MLTVLITKLFFVSWVFEPQRIDLLGFLVTWSKMGKQRFNMANAREITRSKRLDNISKVSAIIIANHLSGYGKGEVDGKRYNSFLKIIFTTFTWMSVIQCKSRMGFAIVASARTNLLMSFKLCWEMITII